MAEPTYFGPFRSEALVSDGELRLEVAKAVVRQIGRNEKVLLRHNKKSRFCQSLMIQRESSRVTVHGSYDRKAGKSDITALAKGGSYSEKVHGGVHQHASLEGESIIGGAYNANQVGPFLRMTAFCDFLGWGVWSEADATRVELCVTAIRAYMGYNHTVGIRTYICSSIIDDWINRSETFVALTDNQAEATVLGGPGAVMQNEM